ncbi:MAG: DUF5597 domain-containing protein [Cellvibrionaceae bacterium]|nr:DUF5597 domain-containing protein [Cellvibrionaceae bacterium]
MLFTAGGVHAAAELPQIKTSNGRHALFVDNKPYLILGIQTNNSTNYAAALKDVWPVAKLTQANTLSIPIAWEQIEPKEDHFDFSFVDYLIKDARRNNIRLILLWFATWKNNAPHYAPGWVKLDDKRFPRVVKPNGESLNSLSPLHSTTLEADKKAFRRLMAHLKKVDKKRTVIMVQVENEVGTYGAARDYSPTAEKRFQQAVPNELVTALNLPPGKWREVFGAAADESFHAYHIAKYCDAIAAASKAIYPLPMNVNVALRNPFNPGKPGQYASGGPTDNMLPIWKAAAPNIDLLSPDIYFRDYKTVSKVLELYSRPDNPLFVSEIGNDQPYARYFFATMGKQGIGFVPFGMDYTGYTNYPLGAPSYTPEAFQPFAEIYGLMAPWAHVWAALSFEKPTWGFAEPVDTQGQARKIWNAQASPEGTQPSPEDIQERAKNYTQRADMGLWDVEVTYGRPMFWTDPPKGNPVASGGALVAKLGDNQFLVTALHARVDIKPSEELKGQRSMHLRVEEGHFDSRGNWVFERVWNGDQTDWGLNFDAKHHLLKITMATY